MLIRGDARQLPLRDECVDAVVTSPPYWGLRDYGNDAQIGLEASWGDYVDVAMLAVFREVRRVLKPSGTVWVNIGDSYSVGGICPGGSEKQRSNRGTNTGIWRKPDTGLPSKNLVGIPWRVAFALQADGWYLRSDIIWAKPNPMPESVTDRPTKAHEYLFLLTKSERYFYDAQAIAEPVSAAMLIEMDQGYEGLGLKDYEAAGVQNPSSVKARIIANARQRRANAESLQGEVPLADSFSSGERLVELSGVLGGDRVAEARDSSYGGKHAATHPQAAGRRLLRNVADARAAGADHDSPFGATRNKRTVWTVNTMPYSGAHFATMPEKLVEPCILAGCPLGGLVLDPFVGSGTVVAVAERLGRRGVGVDLSYQHLAKERTAQRGLRFDPDPVVGLPCPRPGGRQVQEKNNEDVFTRGGTKGYQ